jgi:hypothetical protein
VASVQDSRAKSGSFLPRSPIPGGELCALQLEDLNFDYRVFTIRRSVWKSELQNEIGNIFAQICPNGLRLKQVSRCQYNQIGLKVLGSN